MANLQVKNIDDNMYEQVKKLALSENRSVSQQVLHLIKLYLANKKFIKEVKTPAQTLLELSGAWDDEKDAEDIIAEIKNSRSNSKKLVQGF